MLWENVNFNVPAPNQVVNVFPTLVLIAQTIMIHRVRLMAIRGFATVVPYKFPSGLAVEEVVLVSAGILLSRLLLRLMSRRLILLLLPHPLWASALEHILMFICHQLRKREQLVNN